MAQSMDRHFAGIAPAYNAVRTTDEEPVRWVVRRLEALAARVVLDVGCGAGRYDRLFLEAMPSLELLMVDANRPMLVAAARHVRPVRGGAHALAQAHALRLPVHDASADAVLSFNAIHHFDAEAFLAEAARVVRPGGRVFVYTRLPTQNRETVWGRFFPGFATKEARLPSLASIDGWASRQEDLGLRALRFFRYPRVATVKDLVRQAKARHYSTFSLYEEGEFAQALRVFQERLRRHYGASAKVSWEDANVLACFERASRPEG